MVNTIEDRDLGEVVEETSSPEMLEVVIETSKKKIEEDLKSLLCSLGFNNYEIQDISSDETDR